MTVETAQAVFLDRKSKYKIRTTLGNAELSPKIKIHGF